MTSLHHVHSECPSILAFRLCVLVGQFLSLQPQPTWSFEPDYVLVFEFVVVVLVVVVLFCLMSLVLFLLVKTGHDFGFLLSAFGNKLLNVHCAVPTERSFRKDAGGNAILFELTQDMILRSLPDTDTLPNISAHAVGQHRPDDIEKGRWMAHVPRHDPHR